MSNAIDTLPAGRYFVGDPCYVIANDKWDTFLESGPFAGIDMIEFEGGFAGVADTMYGDGEYHIEGGYPPGPLPVDAGLLGAVSENLIAQKYDVEELAELGIMVDFPSPFRVYREGSVVVIGHLRIETGDDEDDGDDDRWY